MTVEALAARLEDAPRGLLVYRDELAGWLRGFDQFKGGRGGDVAHWLTTFNARDLLVNRKTGDRATIYVERAAVSVAGGIQPGMLRRSLGDEHFEDGLAARLLVAMPPRLPKRWTERVIDGTVEERYARVVDGLLALTADTDADGRPVPRAIPLTPAGKASWVSWYHLHAERQNEAVGPLAAALSKLEAYAARLALLFSLVRAVDSGVGHVEGVDERDIRAGTALVDWFVLEVARVYGAVAETDADRQQRELIELIQRKGGRITVRTMMRSSRRWQTAGDAEAALDALGDAGLGRWQRPAPAAHGGQPTRVFTLLKVGTDRREAECEAALLQRELRDGTHADLRKTTWQAFADEHVERLPGESNAKEAERVLREFGEAFDQPDPKRVTYMMVEQYVSILRDKGNATTTRNKKLKYLRAAFNKAVDRGYLARSPMKGLRLETEEEKAIRIVADAEEKRLIESAERQYGFRWRVLVLSALGTGGRRSELLRLSWSDVDLEAEKLVFRSTKAKRDRVVPITPELVGVLRRLKVQTLQAGGPFRGMEDGLYREWGRITREAGVPELNLHDLRRTYITRLIRAGVPLPTVQKLAGHSDIKTTLRYYNQVNEADLRDAMNKLRERGAG